ncbi:30S ribosomal protein S13 [Candidatus Woesearchaeota archaeon]|nr:30S ribosomal protein S13 [Candidatus Woesearchaeota archaeon]
MVDQELRHIVRIAKTDLRGELSVVRALRGVKGVSFSLANAVCHVAGIQKSAILGLLPVADVERIDSVISSPVVKGIPEWMVNRRKDLESGENIHLSSSDLSYRVENDVKFMRKIRTYKGLRHAFGLPVRGQRTRSNSRRNKGKAVGVMRSAAQKTAAPG